MHNTKDITGGARVWRFMDRGFALTVGAGPDVLFLVKIWAFVGAIQTHLTETQVMTDFDGLVPGMLGKLTEMLHQRMLGIRGFGCDLHTPPWRN